MPPSYYDNIGRYTREKVKLNNQPLFEGVKDEYDKDIKKLKTKLPYFTLSGYQERGRSKDKISYNGCVQIDIDIKCANGEKLAFDVKECFKNHSYIALCGISPSKHGVKALVFTNNSLKDKHRAVTNFVYSLLLQDCSLLNIISKEENIPLGSLLDFLPITQPCFAFYDKDVYSSSEIEVLNVDRVSKDYRLNKELLEEDISVIIEQAKNEVTDKPSKDIRREDVSVLIERARHESEREKGKRGKQENKPIQKTDKESVLSGIEDSPIISKGVERYDYIGRNISIRATKNAKRLTDIYKKGAHRSVKVFKYAGICNTYGVSLDVAREQALSFDDWNLESRHIEKIRECYERYPLRFGTNKFKLFDRVHLPKPEKSISEGCRLSSVFDTLDLSKNAMICSPTGTGKTYCVVEKVDAPRILVLPTTGLVKDVAHSYSHKNPSLFYQDAKEIHNDNLIAVTYHSFAKLCERINIEDYLVFVDEGHNTTSSISWLPKQLTQVVDLLPKAKGYYIFTATPLISTHPAISSLGIINIEEKSPIPKHLKYCIYEGARERAVLEIVAKNKLKGIQTLILFNNKNETTGQLGALLECLKGYNVACVNADKKDEDNYQKIVVEGDIRGFDVVISTTVLKEGNSITKHAPEVQCLIIGAFHPCEIEQFSARTRNVKRRDVLILKSADSKDIESSFLAFSEVKKVNKREEIALISCNLVLNSKHHSIEMKDNYRAVWSKLQHNCIDVNKIIYESVGKVTYEASINQLKVSGELFKGEMSCASSDSIFMLSYLKECYSWNVDLPSKEELYEFTSGEIDKETKDFIKAKNKANKEREQAYIEEIISDIREQGKELNSKMFDALDKDKEGFEYLKNKEGKELKRRDEIEYKLRKRAGIISSEIKSFSKAMDIISVIGANDKKYSEYYTKLGLDKIKRLIKIEGANNMPFKSIDHIVGSGKIGDKFTKLDFVNMLNGAQDILGLAHYSVNDSGIYKKVRYFFDIKRCNIKKGGERICGYEIVSTNPSGLDLTQSYDSSSIASGETKKDITRDAISKLYGIDDKDTLDVLMMF
tara:strand:- start:329 stop:3496 length:3168 start_codon:yes stop_codon:yes gene_type:complete